MNTSPFRTRIGPIISALGSVLIVTGFCLPLLFTSPPSNPSASNPYPPVLNGWQIIHFMGGSALELVFLLSLAVIILSTSLLVLFHQGSLVAGMRSLAAFASTAVLCRLWVFSLLMNWTGSADAGAFLPRMALGPGIWWLLLGTVLSAIGVGSAGIGAMIGAFVGTVIGFVLAEVMVIVIRPFYIGVFLFFSVFVSVSTGGSILGGWVLLRRQSQFHHSTVNRESHPLKKET